MILDLAFAAGLMLWGLGLGLAVMRWCGSRPDAPRTRWDWPYLWVWVCSVSPSWDLVSRGC